MASGNDSSVTEFVLLGLTQQPELQLPLFFLFLGIYVMAVVGNLGLIVLIVLNSHLHTPMYYFLFNLSFVDLCYSCVIIPRMLMSFVKENVILYAECLTQLFFFCFFVIDECCILTSMAYDRYVAICQPLLYKVIMSPQICLVLTAWTYAMGFFGAMAHTICMLRLTFCEDNIINHYMCDIAPLLLLSCTITYVNELVIFVVLGINTAVPSVTLFVSYSRILCSILHIRSSHAKSKAFSTCSSHMITVCLFFGSAALTYFKPFPAESLAQGKLFSIFYTIVGPMMNPLIYSLRNKDVHVALSKMMKKKLVFS
ncbi:olfactory receptor 8B8-like [Ochotona princeps]|uniref:olfactory receptor 8B8-like n=1 Tax=Ochotona princeps TaxID=9978 RepID=UPI0027153790|nr:olfactory receptor 8B8-like [Ochotona princeps]